MKIVDTDYGPKMQTDMSWCVNDGACQRINACPSFEEVTVTRKQPPRMADEDRPERGPDVPDMPEMDAPANQNREPEEEDAESLSKALLKRFAAEEPKEPEPAPEAEAQVTPERMQAIIAEALAS